MLAFSLLLHANLIYSSAIKHEKNPWEEIWVYVEDLKDYIDKLEKENNDLRQQLDTHTHDYSEITGNLTDLRLLLNNHSYEYSEIKANLTLIRSQLENHTHDYTELTGEIPVHSHNYSDIIDAPLVLDEIDVITLIEMYSFGAPDYDSDWLTVDQNTELTLNHNIGTTDLFVYLIGKEGGTQTHQIFLGGDKMMNDNFRTQEGAYWYCDETSIHVKRMMTDEKWQEIRILIWKLPTQTIN
jgi:hypothetical protein